MSNIVIATIADNITPTIVRHLTQQTDLDKTLTEDNMTPLINELAKTIYLMMLSAITKEKQKIVLEFGEQMKKPPTLYPPEYYDYG